MTRQIRVGKMRITNGKLERVKTFAVGQRKNKEAHAKRESTAWAAKSKIKPK